MQPQMDKINPLWDSGNYVFMSKVDDDSCLQAINFIQYHNMKQTPLKELNINHQLSRWQCICMPLR